MLSKISSTLNRAKVERGRNRSTPKILYFFRARCENKNLCATPVTDS